MSWWPMLRDEVEALFARESTWDSVAMHAAHARYDLTHADALRKRDERSLSVAVNRSAHEERVRVIAEMRASGASVRAIAMATGRSVGSVHLVLAALRDGRTPRAHGGSARKVAA